MVATLGSVKITAVAGKVLGRANDPGRLDEKIARAIAPGIPATREETSAATTSLYRKHNNYVIILIEIQWTILLIIYK